jgi:hypothetical protein
MIEATISGQMGQPAAWMMDHTMRELLRENLAAM